MPVTQTRFKPAPPGPYPAVAGNPFVAACSCLASQPMYRLRTLSALALGLLLLLPAHADRVDDYLKGEMERHQIPGLALTVIRDGHAVKTAAYGHANLELRVPTAPETVFEIGMGQERQESKPSASAERVPSGTWAGRLRGTRTGRNRKGFATAG